MFDFPNSPVIGQTVTNPTGGATYQWNGATWDGVAPAPTSIGEAPVDGNTYGRLNRSWTQALPLVGGTVSPGPLTVSNPATYAPGATIDPVGQYESPPAGPNPSPAWRPNFASYINTAANGGHFGDATLNSGMFVTTIYGAPGFNVFNLAGLVTYQGTGGSGHQCALVGYANRNTAAPQPTTTVATTLGAPSYTLQVTDVTNLQVPYPMPIMINGHPYIQTAVSGVSGTGTITLSTQVSVVDGTGGNTVQGNNNPQMWGANIYSADNTGLPSSKTNASLGMELDIVASGLDDANVRSAQTIVLANHTGVGIAEFFSALSISGGSGTQAKQIITTNAAFQQSALDTRQATQLSGANAIWLAQGHAVAFDAQGTLSLLEIANPQMLQLNSSTNGLLVFALGGGWSSFNFGRQLFVQTAAGSPTPSIGINSSDGNYPIAITANNGSPQVDFWGMPALTNSSTPPTPLATFSATGCGFNGHAITTKPTITGAKGGNAALASLITALAAYGLVTDSTSA